MSCSSSIVVLKGGLTVRLHALKLAWPLEDRGLQLRPSGDGGLIVVPKAKIMDEDRVEIRKWKAHLVAPVTYEADVHARVT